MLTFNRRIIFVHKVTLDELYCQARLSHTAATDHDQLVLSQKLRTLVSSMLLTLIKQLAFDAMAQANKPAS